MYWLFLHYHIHWYDDWNIDNGPNCFLILLEDLKLTLNRVLCLYQAQPNQSILQTCSNYGADSDFWWPNENLFNSNMKKVENLGFLFNIFQIQRWLAWPSQKKLPDPAQKFLLQTHYYIQCTWLRALQVFSDIGKTRFSRKHFPNLKNRQTRVRKGETCSLGLVGSGYPIENKAV